MRHDDGIRAVAFSPDGRLIATGGDDGSARIWDVATQQPLGMPYRHIAPIRAVAFHPDGRRFLTASEDGTAQLWKLPAPPVNGDVEQITTWIEVITGMELDDAGNVRSLSADEWRHHRAEFQALGGRPILRDEVSQ